MLLPQVPFAGHRREVAGVLEHFGDRHAASRSLPLRALRAFMNDIVQMTQPRLMRVEPRHQRSPASDCSVPCCKTA